MDKNRQPGIDFERIILEKVNLELNPNYIQTNEDMVVDLYVNVARKLDKSQRLLKLNLEVSFFKETENPPLRASVLAAGYFSVKKDEDFEKLKEFSQIQAPAIVFPFVREALANLTMKTGYPPLLIPPMNLVSLIGKPHKKQQKHKKSSR